MRPRANASVWCALEQLALALPLDAHRGAFPVGRGGFVLDSCSAAGDDFSLLGAEPFLAFHSLVADPSQIPACLEVTARCKDGTVMAVRHRQYPVFGVQFHPESIGTASGRALVAAFLGDLE